MKRDRRSVSPAVGSRGNLPCNHTTSGCWSDTGYGARLILAARTDVGISCKRKRPQYEPTQLMRYLRHDTPPAVVATYLHTAELLQHRSHPARVAARHRVAFWCDEMLSPSYHRDPPLPQLGAHSSGSIATARMTSSKKR